MAGLQEYALLDVQHGLAKTPDSFTVDQLVSLPVNAATSFLSLSHHTGLEFAAPFPIKAQRLMRRSRMLSYLAQALRSVS